MTRYLLLVGGTLFEVGGSGTDGPQQSSWSWPAGVEAPAAARRAVSEYLNQTATPDPPLSDIGLVVSEAVTNAVNHAYVDRERGDVRVSVHVDNDEIEVVIEDDGNGLIPRPDTPGLGLGLPLIATIAHRSETRSQPGRGTCLRVWFLRDPNARTLPG